MDNLNPTELREADLPGCKIRLVKGDITRLDARLDARLEADALVNAANTSLSGGGGVDGAIHRAGGPAIMEECDRIRNDRGGIGTGEAVLTTAGNLPADYVIHTAGPVWHGGNNGEERLLAKCYKSCLALAARHQIRRLAFPNISTGVYGFPKQRAAEIAVKTVVNYLKKQPGSLQEVCFVCFDDDNLRYYRQLMPDEQFIRPETGRAASSGS